jgi:hypothetical protein
LRRSRRICACSNPPCWFDEYRDAVNSFTALLDRAATKFHFQAMGGLFEGVVEKIRVPAVVPTRDGRLGFHDRPRSRRPAGYVAAKARFCVSPRAVAATGCRGCRARCQYELRLEGRFLSAPKVMMVTFANPTSAAEKMWTCYRSRR